MKSFNNAKQNYFYRQVKNNLELKEASEKISKQTLKKNINNWFNTIEIYPNFGMVKRENKKELKTDFDKSQLDEEFLRKNKITKAIDSCLLSGYQKQRAFYGDYENFIKEYKGKSSQNKEFASAIDCFGKFCELFNHGFITDFEQTRFGVNIDNFIKDFEQSFEKLDNKQKDIVKKYVNEVLCSILLFNALDRKRGNILVDEEGKINFIDFDDLLLNKGKLFDNDRLTKCLADDLGKYQNAEKVEKLDYTTFGKDKKTKIMPSRKDKYVNYQDLFDKYGFQIGENMLSTIDNMLTINNDMVKAMFANIKAVEPKCSFKEAKEHILEKLNYLIDYRQDLVDTLKEKCNKKDGWCLGNHKCIVSPNQVVNDDFKDKLQVKIYDSIFKIKECKRFLSTYTEKEFEKDYKDAEKLYNIEKAKAIDVEAKTHLQKNGICK